jgi:hypothetical protein
MFTGWSAARNLAFTADAFRLQEVITEEELRRARHQKVSI